MLGSPGTPATEAIRFPTRGPTNRNRKVSWSWGATFGSWAEAANLTVDTPKARIPIFRQNRGIHIFRHLFASATSKSQKRWRLARVKIKLMRRLDYVYCMHGDSSTPILNAFLPCCEPSVFRFLLLSGRTSAV